MEYCIWFHLKRRALLFLNQWNWSRHFTASSKYKSDLVRFNTVFTIKSSKSPWEVSRVACYFVLSAQPQVEKGYCSRCRVVETEVRKELSDPPPPWQAVETGWIQVTPFLIAHVALRREGAEQRRRRCVCFCVTEGDRWLPTPSARSWSSGCCLNGRHSTDASRV